MASNNYVEDIDFPKLQIQDIETMLLHQSSIQIKLDNTSKII